MEELKQTLSEYSTSKNSEQVAKKISDGIKNSQPGKVITIEGIKPKDMTSDMVKMIDDAGFMRLWIVHPPQLQLYPSGHW